MQLNSPPAFSLHQMSTAHIPAVSQSQVWPNARETGESEPIPCPFSQHGGCVLLLVFSWLPCRLHSTHSRVQFQSHLASKLEHTSHLVPSSSKLTYLSALMVKKNLTGLRLRKSCCPLKIQNYETRSIWKTESNIIWILKNFLMLPVPTNSVISTELRPRWFDKLQD